MTNEQVFPWDETSDIDVLEDGDYLVQGKMLEDGESGSGKRMFKAQMLVLEPAIAHGMSLFENFVTGADEAPKAILPGQMGTRRMKKMVKAAQVPASNNVAMLCAGYAGSIYGVTVIKTEDKEGEYKGIPRNRITTFWKVGEKTPQIKLVSGVRMAAGGAAHVSTAGPPPTGATAAMPPQPVATPAPPPPVYAPPPTPAPVVIAPAPAAAPAGPVIQCQICKALIPGTQLAMHIPACIKEHPELAQMG